MMEHDAVVWDKVGNNSHNDPIVSSGEDVKVRWIKTRREIRDPTGKVIAITVEVNCIREVEVGAIMWKGTLDDLPGTADTPTSDIYEVVTSATIPDERGRINTYELGLMRYHKTFPEVQ